GREQRGAGGLGVVLDERQEDVAGAHDVHGAAAEVAAVLGQGEVGRVQDRVGADLVAGGIASGRPCRQRAVAPVDPGLPATGEVGVETVLLDSHDSPLAKRPRATTHWAARARRWARGAQAAMRRWAEPRALGVTSRRVPSRGRARTVPNTAPTRAPAGQLPDSSAAASVRYTVEVVTIVVTPRPSCTPKPRPMTQPR